MHTIASEQTSPWDRDVCLDVGEELVRCFGGRDLRGEREGCEARFSVLCGAPLSHRVQGGLVMVDHSFEALGFKEVKV